MATAKRKNQNQKSHEDDVYFVSIKRPLELRRQILECSKKTIYSLQDYQRLFLFREKKLSEIKRLDQIMRELAYLNNKLNEKLPKHKNFDFIVKSKAEKILTPKQARLHITSKTKMSRAVARKPFKEKSELEKLEDSLNSIEKKLKGLQ